VDDNQFKKLLAALPARLRPFILFLYTTGCRTGEAKQIWTQTKNATPRTLPLVDALVAMLRKQKKHSELLFPVGNFRKAWTSACIKAGLGTRVEGKENGNYGTYHGLIPRDLRRSAVRNMIRVGVSQTVAMSINGPKTIAVFQRYDITDDRDQQAAMTRVGSSLGQVLQTRTPKALKSA
jgi:integrase